MENFHGPYYTMTCEWKSSRRSAPVILASGEPTCPLYSKLNSYCPHHNCDYYFMEKSQNQFICQDHFSESPFMSQLSSSTLLSQALVPSPMDPILPAVKVEHLDQQDDIFCSGLLHDFPLDEFIIEEDRKENESGDLLGSSQPLSHSQRSLPNSQQRSQDNPNVLQVRSLDNSIFSSSFDSYSPSLVISSQNSYQGSGSSYYGSSYAQGSTQSLLQLSYSTLEANCCRKHKKYFEKIVNKPQKIPSDSPLDLDSFSTPTVNGHLKPPFSHNILCALAIYSSPTRQQEVAGVYRFLMDCFPYFRYAGQHWKNSLRHSLATCDWFEKSDVPRTAKKGFKYSIKATRKACLGFEIKKQRLYDSTKLHYRLSGLYVSEYLINIGLLSLSHNKMNELRQAIRLSINHGLSQN